MRRTYPELQSNHIEPMLRMIIPELCTYNATTRTLRFANGATIRFGHWNGELSETEYAGQEYDWIFIDEATQFTWRSFQYLGGLLRGVNDIPKRMYLTCNPGGVGHSWVKRLFIDRRFIRDPNNPEADENPDDYLFIPATVEDNEALLRSSPGYLKMLSSMPEDLRRAYRYGDWDALGGAYFPEFAEGGSLIPPFTIPEGWTRYRAFDYGLDMLACAWFAVDEQGRSYMYREYSRPGLIVSEAARAILEHTPPDESIALTFAPPDMWSRQKDTGRTMAEVFLQSGVPIVRADNNRVQGHMLLRQALSPGRFEPPRLLIFNTCRQTADDLRDIQADRDDPNDCAKSPHEVTHRVDALRYYAVSRICRPETREAPEDGDGEEQPYDDYMTGGLPGEDYMGGYT